MESLQEGKMPMVKHWLRRGVAASLVGLAACGPGEAAQAQRAPTSAAKSAGAAVSVPVDTITAVRLSSAFRGAADRALPAVVSIRVVQTQRIIRGQPRIFRFFPDMPGFDEAPQELEVPTEGTGSGFIFDERGYIMTNRHVVNDADEVVVTLADGHEYRATVVGTDAMTDVAVIRIEPDDDESLPVAALGDSDALQVGDWVLALGNPLGLDFTVTAGIVSAKSRNVGILRREADQAAVEAFIQTDAAINPGNSGGPLVDLQGRVVGVNTAIASRTGYYAGYGFAIPIAVARKVANDLIEYGVVRRPRLGVAVEEINATDAEVYGLEEVAGAEVKQVQEDTPAERAGLKIGDVVVALDGKPIESATQLISELARRQPGERVELGIIRDRKRRTVTVELGQFEPIESREERRAERPEVEELLGFRAAPLTRELARRFELDADADGVVVVEVDRFSPAAQAGIRPGYLLLRLNGREIEDADDVRDVARDLEPGDVVSAVVRIPEQGETIINYRTRQ
ncbi:MAG TPA: Do family serine endopeptidase [Longimicrobiales bacterium]